MVRRFVALASGPRFGALKPNCMAVSLGIWAEMESGSDGRGAVVWSRKKVGDEVRDLIPPVQSDGLVFSVAQDNPKGVPRLPRPLGPLSTRPSAEASAREAPILRLIPARGPKPSIILRRLATSPRGGIPVDASTSGSEFVPLHRRARDSPITPTCPFGFADAQASAAPWPLLACGPHPGQPGSGLFEMRSSDAVIERYKYGAAAV